ncbi:MAG: histone deacetylase family protein [Acidimicrobiales bacterium]|nr:histone deacetylase family protein [Hyphomonadaceae bacterium]RZV42395.1 MAG: histone deacetylase family protein [Acidimicrobiales bacterium]
MKTALLSHPDTQGHVGLDGYQENPNRVMSVMTALEDSRYDFLIRESAPHANREDLLRVHPPAFVDFILETTPPEGEFVHIDYDTALSPGTADAASRAAGAVCHALDGVIDGRFKNAFCATRPPGHHTEPERAMGFCFFSNIAIAAQRARQVHNIQKIAVVDFDVHHGNGTQAALWDTEDMYFGSIHQHPHYPNTGVSLEKQGKGFVRNIPMPGGTSAADWRKEYDAVILKDVDSFKPDLILVSAGFDAHKDDPLGEFNLLDEDYHRLGAQLQTLANVHCDGRLVAALEGGYNLDALARSTCAFIDGLQSA